jgi:hypothetical protein
MTPEDAFHLEQARELLAELEIQRTRLAVAVWGNAWLADDAPLEGLIFEIDRFVGGTFARVEARALAGEPGAALRLRDATARILGAVTGVQPLTEGFANAAQLAADVVKDTSSTLGALVSGLERVAGALALGAAAYVAVELVRAWRERGK